MSSKDLVVVTGDGSCSGNPGPGGWATHVEFEDGSTVVISGQEPYETTNNRMEMMAIIKGLEEVEALDPDVQIRVESDSSYLVRSMANGWRRAKNLDLWDQLDALDKSLEINWTYIPRNSTNAAIECDTMAKQATQRARGSARSKKGSAR